jgi:hypothetical protein
MGRISAVGGQRHGLPYLSLHGPRSVLEHDAIPAEILECLPLYFANRDYTD